MRNLLGIPIIFISLTSSVVYGQWYDRIETESDWEAFYREGYFDYNTYQIYREIIETENVADTLEYVVSSMGSSPGEMAGNNSNIGKRQSLSSRSESRLFYPDYIKFGRKIYSGDNRGYVTIGRKFDSVSTRFKFEDDNGTWRSAYRHIAYTNGDLDLTIGNYTVEAGCGAGLGLFDYRPVSFEPVYDRGEDWLFPDNSYYNGLNAGYGPLSVIYSSKKYNDARKTVVGGYLVRDIDNYKIGLTSAVTILTLNSQSRKLGSGSVFGEIYDGGLTAEIAYAESGFGYCLRVLDDDYVLKAWHYDKSYTNLQSSGFAYPDYESFSDDRFELSFRQPQKGETGMYTSYSLNFRDGKITGSSELWKKLPGSEIAMFNTVYGRWNLARKFSLNAGLSYRNNNSEKLIVDFGTIYSHIIKVEARVYLRILSGAIDKDYSKYYIFASVPVGDNVSLRGRFRWNFTGEFDYFIEQKTKIADGFSLSATYRWSRDYAPDLGPFYLILGKTW